MLENDSPQVTTSVQKIQDSMRTIETRAAAHQSQSGSEQALTLLLNTLGEQTRRETREEHGYQDLYNAVNIPTMLADASIRMAKIASDTTTVLRDKYDINVDRHGYDLLKSLPWQRDTLINAIKENGEDGPSTRAMWEIERQLRESQPPAEPSAPSDVIRVDTDRNSEDFAKAVNTLAQHEWFDLDESLEVVEFILGTLRGRSYPQRDDPETA